MKYLRYLSYVLRHKWFVLLAGRRLGVTWRALLHDNSKFLPIEFFPYADFFYGAKPVTPERKLAFDLAWLHHQKRNRHHWQWWILSKDDGGTKVFEMPDPYRREMLADWIGAGRAITGKYEVQSWYLANRQKMVLGHETRAWIENALCIPDEA